jgi:predicted transcriptional regulator YdeE
MHIKKKLYIINSVETNNFNDSQIMQKIGGLWQKVAKLSNNIIKYGVYHNYKSDFKGNYVFSVAIENQIISESDPLEIDGDYMVFNVDTNVETPIVKAWKEIWSMPINRAYTFDFEQYNSDGTIQIYIAVKIKGGKYV